LSTPTYLRERRRLAERLRALREQTKLSGNQYAKQLGWPQSKVSKIETAKQLPTEDDIQAWAEGLGAGADTVGELLALLEGAREEYASWKQQYRAAGGAAGKQADSGALEDRATRIREFVPAFIPGLVQTAEYAREMLYQPAGPRAFGADDEDIECMIAARMQRQQVLYQPGKQIQTVVLEAALRSLVCSPATLAGQLDRLLAVSGLRNLEFGVIPFEASVPAYPLAGFAIFDSDLVLVETMTGEQQLSDPEEVALYERAFDLLRDAARTGRDAVTIIRRSLTALPDPASAPDNDPSG
jgi:transcriptional regulator with XRE-family HTH domain